MICLMGSFDFAIGVGVVAVCSFKDEVEFIVEHATKFGVASKGTLFVCSDGDHFVTLTEERRD